MSENGISDNSNITKPRDNWVHFDDANTSNANNKEQLQVTTSTDPLSSNNNKNSAVLNTDTEKHVVSSPIPASAQVQQVQVQVPVTIDVDPIPLPLSQHHQRNNVGHGHIRTGFANGDVVVTLLPVNTKWPWITAAKFRPELVPEELMAQGLTLTVEEYVQAMELLVNDYRFTLYNVCYKRVLVCWIAITFTVLMALLFSGLTGLVLFSLGVVWLLLNAATIFVCMWIKLKLSKGLEKCLGRVNKQLMKHKLLLTLDDRGKMSCHKVTLCFMFFDSAPCIAHLQQVIERDEGSSIPVGWERRLDVTSNDIVIQGNQTTRLSRKQSLAEEAFLRYLQRWGKDFLRHRLDWTLDEEGGNPAAPRHLTQALCPCQYTEELLRNKPRRDPHACFPHCNNWLKRRGID